MSAPDWMPLYVATYIADTRHLSTVEHGAYLLLIMHYWQHGGLPIADDKLARICGLTMKHWEEIRGTISDLFELGPVGEWIHERIDIELETACKLISRRKSAGRVAGRASAAARQRRVNDPLNDRQRDVNDPFNDRSTIVERSVDQSSTPIPRHKKEPSQEEESFEESTNVADETPSGGGAK